MVKQYNMCMISQIVWYNSKRGGDQRKENSCTECLCLCAHARVKLCVLVMSVYCLDMLSCPDLRMKTASNSSWGGSSTSFFFNLKYLFCGS